MVPVRVRFLYHNKYAWALLFQVSVLYSTATDNIDIGDAIESGRPRAASEEKGLHRWIRTSRDLWGSHSFQIIVVAISLVLLIYTIIGECHWVTSKQLGRRLEVKRLVIRWLRWRDWFKSKNGSIIFFLSFQMSRNHTPLEKIGCVTSRKRLQGEIQIGIRNQMLVGVNF